MAWLGRKGVRLDEQVVAYDDSGGIYAARLWWMLRWIGHHAVAVLDGGYAKWQAEGRPTTASLPTFAAVIHTGQPDMNMIVGPSTVTNNFHSHEFQLVDARSANRYAGGDETMDPVAGHIPGAINRPYQMNLANEGIFKTPDELRQEYRELLDRWQSDRIVHQCGSGVTACHNLLAMDIAGLSGSRLYPGSWSEWCSDPRRPVNIGPYP